MFIMGITILTRAMLNAERPLDRLDQYMALNDKYIDDECHTINVWRTRLFGPELNSRGSF